MGTIRIEDCVGSGGRNSLGSVSEPVIRGLLNITVDAATSTTAGSYALDGSAGLISVSAVEGHRISFGVDTTGSVYYYIGAGERRDIGVPSGVTTLHYRLDA